MAINAGARLDPNDAVDAVYTWVNGSDPAFRDALRHHSSSQPDGGRRSDHRGRFRDNGELRCSLRSLDAYAPWIRRVHILTNGSAPAWLDRSGSRFHVVRHEEVFQDPAALPTFNSQAIEMNLHRIPGLARRFIYFNDDFFLGRPVEEGDFFLPGGGERLFLERTLLPSNPGKGSARDRALAHTREVLDRLWGPASLPRLLPAHAPRAYDRERIEELEALLPGEFRETSAHRFRSGNDLDLQALYAHSAWEDVTVEGRHERVVLPDPRWPYWFVMLVDHPWAMLRTFARILRSPPTFFCVNDDLGDVPSFHPLLLALRATLLLHRPQRGPFERGSPR